MNLSEASKKEIDVVLEKCGWRQTKQRVVLLKSIFEPTWPQHGPNLAPKSTPSRTPIGVQIGHKTDLGSPNGP